MGTSFLTSKCHIVLFIFCVAQTSTSKALKCFESMTFSYIFKINADLSQALISQFNSIQFDQSCDSAFSCKFNDKMMLLHLKELEELHYL